MVYTQGLPSPSTAASLVLEARALVSWLSTVSSPCSLLDVQEEDAFLDGSDFEGISESESEEESEGDDDWQPGGRWQSARRAGHPLRVRSRLDACACDFVVSHPTPSSFLLHPNLLLPGGGRRRKSGGSKADVSGGKAKRAKAE